MSRDATLSRRPPRRFWGWGQADALLSERELAAVKAMVGRLGVRFELWLVPQVAESALPEPRVAPPPALAAMFSAAPLDRLNHCAQELLPDAGSDEGGRAMVTRRPETPDMRQTDNEGNTTSEAPKNHRCAKPSGWKPKMQAL